MLKKKIARKATYKQVAHEETLPDPNNNNKLIKTSNFFNTPLWQKVYNLECELNENLCHYQTGNEITHIYNPVEYAAQLHCEYLRHYLKGTKILLFIGMNPGYDGMGQTGIPFGNITTVRDIMGLTGTVNQPPAVHPKRPVKGLASTREEPSGKRLWTLFKELSNGSLDTFFKQCFVHNFCPLVFFNSNGNNITPSELKGPYKQQIRNECLRTTEQVLQLIQPKIIVAIGNYVYDTLKASEYCKSKHLLRLAHPSPRSLNNNNWPEKAEKFLAEEDLLKIQIENISAKFNNFQEVFLMEKHRIDSFKTWPYDENSSCSITKMAEAGFYWTGNKNNEEDDAATCFVCCKQLHGWDPTDDPWKEHMKHAPQCQFVKYGRKENELTVEEFLNITSAVLRKKLTKSLNAVKTRFSLLASTELEKYLAEK
ncbi:Single-strand selective monofunctional uracil-DNA glycosylase [Lucilia cuprina]|nr:Single-strand selective monofunctional uracil-DNA glycosylase [Lucilia cuprina]